MPKNVKVWKILPDDTLEEVSAAKLGSEKRVENWVKNEISVISNDLLVIGHRVWTGFGAIDVLCIDRYGDIVAVELKREPTVKDVVAQILDYGSWVKDLLKEGIIEIANLYLGNEGPLEEAFRKRFGMEIPKQLNDGHELLIVAPDLDSGTRRIIEYLSGYYSIRINAVVFDYFHYENGNEFIVRVFPPEPVEIGYSAIKKGFSKARPRPGQKELQQIADSQGIGEMYRLLMDGLSSYIGEISSREKSIAFIGKSNKSRPTIFRIILADSNSESGIRFQVYIDRLMEHIGVGEGGLYDILPENLKESFAWKGGPLVLTGFFKNLADIDKFLTGLHQICSVD